MARFRDQAICVRHFDWSETSEVVVLMTERHGKVRGLAKGSKRLSPSSVQRFSGGIELLTRGEILGVVRASTELATLTEWDLQDNYAHLRRDLEAQRIGLYAADIVNAMMADEDAHPRTFVALRTLLEALAQTGGRPAALLQFQWELLSDAGFRPEIWQDVRDGQPLADQAAYTFDPRAGGLTASDGMEDWRVRKQSVTLLRKVAEKADLAEEDEQAVRRVNRLLCVYMRAILDQELPTMGFVLA